MGSGDRNILFGIRTPAVNLTHSLGQGSGSQPFLASGTGFMEGTFSTDWGGGIVSR